MQGEEVVYQSRSGPDGIKSNVESDVMIRTDWETGGMGLLYIPRASPSEKGHHDVIECECLPVDDHGMALTCGRLIYSGEGRRLERESRREWRPGGGPMRCDTLSRRYVPHDDVKVRIHQVPFALLGLAA